MISMHKQSQYILAENTSILFYIAAPSACSPLANTPMNTPTLSRSPAKTYVDFVSGPVKIKDALYIGDEIAARDMDFIISNKVTHIINTVVKKVPNLYEKFGVQYLSVNWTEKEQNIFDLKNNSLSMIFTFVEEAMDQGESVLVHSQHGKSRAGCVIIAYLMKKYMWSLQKCVEYVTNKKETFKIRSGFLSQLQELERRLGDTYNLSKDWSGQGKNEEDLIMINTYRNSKAMSANLMGGICGRDEVRKSKKRVEWGEKVVVGPSSKSYGHNILTSATKYRQYCGGEQNTLKSILKNETSRTSKDTNVQKQEDKDKDKDKDNDNDKQRSDLQNITVTTPMKKRVQPEWQQVEQSSRMGASMNNNSNVSQSMNMRHHTDEERLLKSQVLASNIGSIRGNVIHVVVNNFISNPIEQQQQQAHSTRYSSIPTRNYASEKKKLESKSGPKLTPYENIISSIKSPYDNNFIARVGGGPSVGLGSSGVGGVGIMESSRARKFDSSRYANTHANIKQPQLYIHDNRQGAERERPQSVNTDQMLRRRNENEAKYAVAGLKTSANKEELLHNGNGTISSKGKYTWTSNAQTSGMRYK